MKRRFVRQDSTRYSKLGKGRRKLQKWRKPKGRDSKMRLRRKSYPKSPSVGQKTPAKKVGKIKNLTPIIVRNVEDLMKAGKNSVVIIAKVGAKKKLEIIKQAQENKIQMLNVTGDTK